MSYTAIIAGFFIEKLNLTLYFMNDDVNSDTKIIDFDLSANMKEDDLLDDWM